MHGSMVDVDACMVRRCMVETPAWRVLAAPISYQLLRALLREDEEAAGGGDDASRPDQKPLPDLDFVMNFGDAPKAIHLPDGGRVNGTTGMGGDPIGAGIPPAEADLSSLRPPPACAAYDFSYGELERAPQGPFGVITSEDMPAYRPPCTHVAVTASPTTCPQPY